jgi:hypothetical protein
MKGRKKEIERKREKSGAGLKLCLGPTWLPRRPITPCSSVSERCRVCVAGCAEPRARLSVFSTNMWAHSTIHCGSIAASEFSGVRDPATSTTPLPSVDTERMKPSPPLESANSRNKHARLTRAGWHLALALSRAAPAAYSPIVQSRPEGSEGLASIRARRCTREKKEGA